MAHTHFSLPCAVKFSYIFSRNAKVKISFILNSRQRKKWFLNLTMVQRHQQRLRNNWSECEDFISFRFCLIVRFLATHDDGSRNHAWKWKQVFMKNEKIKHRNTLLLKFWRIFCVYLCGILALSATASSYVLLIPGQIIIFCGTLIIVRQTSWNLHRLNMLNIHEPSLWMLWWRFWSFLSYAPMFGGDRIRECKNQIEKKRRLDKWTLNMKRMIVSNTHF